MTKPSSNQIAELLKFRYGLDDLKTTCVLEFAQSLSENSDKPNDYAIAMELSERASKMIMLVADYTDEEKKIRVVDGDNGLWLCANHDKMFEFGIIYFENSVMKIGAFITENLQKTFISNSIFDVRQLYFGGNSSTTFEIKPEHYNNNMKNYLSKHTTRVA